MSKFKKIYKIAKHPLTRKIIFQKVVPFLKKQWNKRRKKTPGI